MTQDVRLQALGQGFRASRAQRQACTGPSRSRGRTSSSRASCRASADCKGLEPEVPLQMGERLRSVPRHRADVTQAAVHVGT